MEHDQFILFIAHLPFHAQTFYSEHEAQRAAEEVARANRGTSVSIAKVIASVCEPLPTLQWTDDRVAGDGQRRDGGVMGLNTVSPKYDAAQKAETPRPR